MLCVHNTHHRTESCVAHDLYGTAGNKCLCDEQIAGEGKLRAWWLSNVTVLLLANDYLQLVSSLFDACGFSQVNGNALCLYAPLHAHVVREPVRKVLQQVSPVVLGLLVCTDALLHLPSWICVACNGLRAYAHVWHACTASRFDLAPSSHFNQ